ncbi:hypothetical protein Tco_0444600 [Tanacetum coccineum]
MAFSTLTWHCGCLPDVLSFLSGWKTFDWESKATRRSLISPGLRRSDKLYKFCDSTLSSVRRVLHDIASILEMDYLPKRRWSKLDRKRSRIMIKAIDQQLFERRLMRNLKRFVGGREYENYFRLLERKI